MSQLFKQVKTSTDVLRKEMIQVTEKKAKEARNKHFYDFVKDVLVAADPLFMMENNDLVKRFYQLFSYGKLRDPIFLHEDLPFIMLRALYENKIDDDDFWILAFLQLAKKHFGAKSVSLETVKWNKKYLHDFIAQERLLENRSVSEMAGLFKTLDFDFFKKEAFKSQRFFIKISVQQSMKEFELLKCSDSSLFNFSFDGEHCSLLVPHPSLWRHINQFLYRENFCDFVPRLTAKNTIRNVKLLEENKIPLNILMPGDLSDNVLADYFESFINALSDLKIMQLEKMGELALETSPGAGG